MPRHVLLAVFLAPVLTLAGAAPAPAPAPLEGPFARPQQLVDIGGRRLNLYCSGTGPVTVVFDADGRNAGWSWRAVQPRVAGRTRACVYDRAGLGFSDPSGAAPTSPNAVRDLHLLLSKAGIAPPYIMVGSSYGGINAQLYAYRYPAQVKGLVLVDTGHESEIPRIAAASQGKMTEFLAMYEGFLAKCAQAAQGGFVAGSDAAQACTGGEAGTGPALAAARLAMLKRPTYWQTALAEYLGYPASHAALAQARRSFGALPLVVLTRGVSEHATPGEPPSALNQAVEDENLAMHKEIAALSTRASHRVVEGASHIIHETHPEAVVQAVFEVMARAASPD